MADTQKQAEAERIRLAQDEARRQQQRQAAEEARKAREQSNKR